MGKCPSLRSPLIFTNNFTPAVRLNRSNNQRNKMAKKTETVVVTSVRNNRKSIHLEWINGTDEYSVTFHDNPLPSFFKALDVLNPHVCSLCELPVKDAEKIQATGITVREKGDNSLALIVARKKIRKGKRMFNIATPLLAMYEDSEDKSVDHMEEVESAAIEKVIKEAMKYIAGERAQGQITFEDEKPKKDGEEKTTPFPELTNS